jgi:hypothetical protein
MIDKAMVNINYNGVFYRLNAMSNAGICFTELDAPIIYLDRNATEIELGQAVLKLLPYYKKVDVSLFKTLIPKINEAGLLREANEMQTYGYSSRNKLYQSNISCSISFYMDKHHFEITPTHHDRLDGYSGINKVFHISDTSTAQEIGEAIKKGLRLCTAKSSYKLPVVL